MVSFPFIFHVCRSIFSSWTLEPRCCALLIIFRFSRRRRRTIVQLLRADICITSSSQDLLSWVWSISLYPWNISRYWPMFCLFENHDRQHKFITNQICWPSFEEDLFEVIIIILVLHKLCHSMAKLTQTVFLGDQLTKLTISGHLVLWPTYLNNLE